MLLSGRAKVLSISLNHVRHHDNGRFNLPLQARRLAHIGLGAQAGPPLALHFKKTPHIIGGPLFSMHRIPPDEYLYFQNAWYGWWSGIARRPEAPGVCVVTSRCRRMTEGCRGQIDSLSGTITLGSNYRINKTFEML